VWDKGSPDWEEGYDSNSCWEVKTSDDVNWALVGYDIVAHTFKVFFVGSESGTVANGEFCWVNVSSVISFLQNLWTGDSDTGKVYRFYLVPCSDSFLSSLTDAQAGQEGLLRLWPITTVSASVRGDGTLATMAYTCDCKLVRFIGLEIADLCIAYSGGTSWIDHVLQENDWPVLVPAV
jgi:hypothetical protein